jgi:hypothetical protein
VRGILEDEGALLVCVLSQLNIDEESGINLPLFGGQSLSSVTGMFSAENCPIMSKRPKIFLCLDLNQGKENLKTIR